MRPYSIGVAIGGFVLIPGLIAEAIAEAIVVQPLRDPLDWDYKLHPSFDDFCRGLMAYKHTPDYLQGDLELQREFEFSFGQRPGIPFTRHNDIVVCGVHHTCSLEQDEQADVYARTATPL